MRLARVQRGERALDLCCGTGDIALELARRGARVVGVDFSAPMLGVARRRAQSGAFVRGDALRLPFPDRAFDVVTIGYGLRNLASFEAALREMNRVLRPGGRLLILDFGKPPNRVWRSMYFAYLQLIVPIYGRLFCGSAAAYSYILESLQHYPSQEGVADLMRANGFTEVKVINLLGGVMGIQYGIAR